MFLFFIKAKDVILDILFPPICLNCQKNIESNEFICKNCLNLIKINNALFCPACFTRRPYNKKICSHAYYPNYMLAAATNYDNEAIKNLIHYFKYKNFKSLAPFFGEIILEYIKNSEINLSDYEILYIPLYKNRERQRGYNQSKLIAKYVASSLNLPLINNLKRTRNTKPQASLKNNSEREKNTKNCFELTHPEEIKNKKIILIDDVFTSGATMNEAVKILKDNYAKKIIALVIAKA